MSEYTYETGFNWDDPLAGEMTQFYLQQRTAVDLENEIKLQMDWQRTYYEVVRNLGGNYKALVNTTKDNEAVKYLRATAYWVGGERGQRAGRERGKRMIKEAYQFAEIAILPYASLLDDGEGEGTE